MFHFDDRMKEFLSQSANKPSEPEQSDRDALQRDALNAFLRNHRLILEWGTSVGKSRVGVLAVKELWRRGFRKMLLLVAETDHKRNWKEEFIKALGEPGEALYDNLCVECYNSMKKCQDTEWDLIIADEAHHLRSENRVKQLSSIKANFFLCVSATMNDNGDGDDLEKALDETFGLFERKHFTVQQGINSGFIGEPKIVVHLLNMDRVPESQSIRLSWGHAKKRIKISCTPEEFKTMEEDRDVYPHVEAEVKGSAIQLYHLLENEIDGLQKRIKQNKENAHYTGGTKADRMMKDVTFMQTRVKLLGNIRKTLMGESKTGFVKMLLDNLNGKRYVCFASTVEQGNILAAERVVSARKSSKENSSIIRTFNDGDEDSLFAIGMLREGTNLGGIQSGVIVQLGNKEREFIQKFGRTLRADSPVQHLIVFDDTKDVDYFFKSIDGVNPKYLKVYR